MNIMGNQNQTPVVGNINFGPWTHPDPTTPIVYGPKPSQPTAILTEAQEQHLKEMMDAYNKSKVAKSWFPKVGYPVWINDYIMRDGKHFRGWGICIEVANHTDYITVQVWHEGNTVIISSKNFSEKESEKETIREASFIDADGNNVKVSYGEYETENGIEKIFGIDSPQETVSFVLNDLSTLIQAIQKVKP